MKTKLKIKTFDEARKWWKRRLQSTDETPLDYVYSDLFDSHYLNWAGYNAFARPLDQFFTPPEVCEQVADLVKYYSKWSTPSGNEGDRILDLCCGFGGLLEPLLNGLSETRISQIYGVELDIKLSEYARIIGFTNTITSSFDKLNPTEYDVIVSNPPFSKMAEILEWLQNSKPYTDIFLICPVTTKDKFSIDAVFYIVDEFDPVCGFDYTGVQTKILHLRSIPNSAPLPADHIADRIKKVDHFPDVGKKVRPSTTQQTTLF